MEYNADTITTPKKYQDRPSLEDAPQVRTSYDYNMKTELTKAVPVMPVPKAVPVSEHLQAYDYTHLLPNGYNSSVRMLLTHHPTGNHKGALTVRLLDTDSGQELGSLMAHHHEQFNELEPQDAYLDKDYRRAGLGQAMYAALYTHAKNALKATHVRGGRHSTYAHRVHQGIAKEFGLDYHAKPNVGAEGYRNETDWHDTPPRSYDAKFGNYRYTLR
jgi:GNAT superfamily N-acetyltransferase